jgi:hypothetical protein
MKLRESNCKETAVKVSRDLHSEMNRHQGRNYIAVVVTCEKVDSIDLGELHEGTIVISFESLNEVLTPFGSSYLLSIVRSKAAAS